jgi:hypothetical protein
MSHNNSPRISPNERYLLKRAERYLAKTPAILVRIAGIAVLLPEDIALFLVRRRKAVVADLLTVAALVITEDDIDSELQQLIAA